MPLQIKTTPGLIGINMELGRQTIRQLRGELKIRQGKAEMHLDRELPKVLIDQYQCFAEAGRKNNRDLMQDIVSRARQKWLQGIERRIREGQMLSHIENKGNPIPAIAVENAYPQHDFNIAFIPKSRPEFTVEGHLNIQWKITEPEIAYQARKPMITYEPGGVDIFIRQWPNIEINYIDEKV